MTIPTTITTTSRPPGSDRVGQAHRASTDSIKAIPATLTSEWIKLATLRSNKAIVGLTIGVGVLMTWAVARYATGDVFTATEIFGFSSVFSAVFAAVLGILLFTSEVQHGTLAGALTAQPARWVVATAKAVVALGVGAGLGLAGLAAGFGGALLSGIEVGETAGLLSTIGWAAGYTGLASLLGLGIGMIARHSAAAISGLLVWWLVVENLMAAFLDTKFARFMPFSAGNGMLGVSNGPDSSAVGDSLSITQNALVFGGYALVAIIVGTVLLQRRDTN